MKKEANTTKITPDLKGCCYVCLKPIKKEGVYIGNGIFRHEACSPGTARWLKSEVGKKSNLRKYFEENEKHLDKSHSS